MAQWYCARLESVLPSGYPGSIPGVGVNGAVNPIIILPDCARANKICKANPKIVFELIETFF